VGKKTMEILVVIKENKMDDIVKITELIKNIATILGIGAASFLGYIAIQKSLKQDIITQKINQIEKSNQELQKKVLDFMTKWPNRSNKSFRITNDELDEIYNDFIGIVNIAINCETIISNSAILVKWFMENLKFINKYDNKGKEITDQVFNIINQSCDKMLVLTSKQIIFPSLINIAFITRKKELYSKKIKQFANNWDIKTISFFEQGVNINPLNAEVISIIETTNTIWDPIVSLAMSRSINSYLPIAVLLYLNDIYFPPVLITPRYDDLLHDYWKLVLIAFRKNERLGAETETFYEFRYATDRSGLGIDKESIEALKIKDSKDGFLKIKEDNLPKEITIEFSIPNTVVISIKKETLDEYSKNRIVKISKKIKEMRNKPL
jgi:hypothetical protein